LREGKKRLDNGIHYIYYVGVRMREMKTKRRTEMKMIVAKNRTEAMRFCEGGRRKSQRVAYWKEGNKAYRFERLPGEQHATWSEGVEGLWWSKTLTVGQKLGVRSAIKKA